MNTGKLGEDMAARYLEANGYTVIARNFHSRWGEIDIIAKDGDCTVFIEVKARKRTDYGLPCEYVTPEKIKKIVKTAMVYLDNQESEMRFDVCEIYLRENKINHIKNAFGGSYDLFL